MCFNTHKNRPEIPNFSSLYIIACLETVSKAFLKLTKQANNFSFLTLIYFSTQYEELKYGRLFVHLRKIPTGFLDWVPNFLCSSTAFPRVLMRIVCLGLTQLLSLYNSWGHTYSLSYAVVLHMKYSMGRFHG